MDIFNRKRVEELTLELERLRDVERERDEYKRLLATAEADLQKVLQLKQQIPEDCVPGAYCEACEFNRAYWYHYYSYLGGPYDSHDRVIRGNICNKANVCKNFIQKEINNGDSKKV